MDARGADVVLLDDPLGIGTGRGIGEDPALRGRSLGLVTEHAVLPQGGVEEQPLAVAVLGDVPDARLTDVPHVPAGDVGALELDPPGGRLPHAHEDLDELRLTIALDTGDAEDLTGTDAQGDVLEHVPARPGEGDPLRREDDPVGDRGLLRLGGGQLGADHELGELAGGDVLGQDGVDSGPAADHGDPVGDGEHLVELVRDEEDGDPLALELAQVAEELVDLLGHEDRGRLVEDDRARTSEQDLEDLHPLAGADAEVGDECRRVDVEAVLVRDPGDLGAGRRADTVLLLRTEDDVLRDGEVVREHEVLEDHADAVLDRIGRAVQRHLLAADPDGPLVGALDPVEHLHERGLAGTVLADDGVHRPLRHAEGDVVVGDDTGEPLGDPLDLDGEVTRRGVRARGRVGVGRAHVASVVRARPGAAGEG